MPVRIFLLMIALCLAGCATPQAELIAYSGPRRADDSVAMIKTQFPLLVEAIDGDKNMHVRAGKWQKEHTTVYLEPGEHRLTLQYFDGIFSSKAPIEFDVYLQPGHRYLIDDSAKQPSIWWGRGGTWHPALEDVTDHMEQWQ
jgi:hypothetical protein